MCKGEFHGVCGCVYVLQTMVSDKENFISDEEKKNALQIGDGVM